MLTILPKQIIGLTFGCTVIVIHPDKNKDIEFIQRLKDNYPHVKLKMILNEICLPNCPMRQGHSNLEGHGNWGDLYRRECTDILKSKPWLLYSSSYITPKLSQLL